MTRNVLACSLALVAACALGTPVLADGSDEFTSESLGVKIHPAKGWKIEKAKDDYGGLVDVSYGESLSGSLSHSTAEEGKTLEAIADESEAMYKEGAKTFERTKSEKLDRKPGEWLHRRFHYVTEHGTAMHYDTVFAKKGEHLFTLSVCSGESLDKHEAALKALVDALDLGGGPATGGDKPAAGAGAAVAPPKTDAPKTDAPKTDAPKTDAPKTDAPKSGGAAAASGGSVENPWAKFAEGSWVEYSIVSEMSGTQTEMTQKTTLVAKGAEELTLKTEGKMTKPMAMDVPANEMKIPAKSPSGGAGGPANTNTKELGKGEETLDVGGKQVKCRWVETEIDAAGQKMVSKVWTSDDVPGGMVKSTTKAPAGTSTMTLLGFEAKK